MRHRAGTEYERAITLVAELLGNHEPVRVAVINAATDAAGLHRRVVRRAAFDHLGVTPSRHNRSDARYSWTLPNRTRRTNAGGEVTFTDITTSTTTTTIVDPIANALAAPACRCIARAPLHDGDGQCIRCGHRLNRRAA